MNEYVRSDLFRYYGKDDYRTLWGALIKDRVFRFQYALRMRQSSGLSRLGGVLLWKFNKTKRYIRIPLETQIGYGLFIGHDAPIIVSPTTIIGNNVNLSQFTTIGTNKGKAATIGDNVYIGPNVCIVEDVVIGNNVTIGAGSVVTKSIPDNATAAGNYARVLHYNNPGRFVNSRYEKFSC